MTLKTLLLAGALSAVALTACGGGGTEPANGGKPARLNDTVSAVVSSKKGTRYDLPKDRTVGFAVFLQGIDGPIGATIIDLSDPDGSLNAVDIFSFPMDSAAEQLGTNVSPNSYVSTPEATLIVTVVPGEDRPTRYRLAILEIDSIPVNGPTDLYPGDTLSSEFGSTLDVDRYVLHANASANVAIFLQTDAGTAGLAVGDTGAGTLVASVTAPGDTASAHLLSYRTPLFRVRPLKPLIVTLGASGISAPSGYRLYVHAVDSNPEHVPAVLAPNDTVTLEGLENSADIDIFTVTPGPGQAGPALGYLGAPYMPMQLDLRANGGPFPITIITSTTSDPARPELESRSTGRFNLSNVRLFVQAQGPNPVALGPGSLPYALQVRLLDEQPESLPDTIAPGDTIVGEAVDYTGDVDAFVIAGTIGQRYTAFLQNLAATPGGEMKLRFFQFGNPLQTFAQSLVGDSVMLDSGAGVLRSLEPLVVKVDGINDTSGTHRGPYRLLVLEVDSLPETASPGLILGDTVTTEVIDFPGDLDEFSFAGTAGQSVTATLQPLITVAGGGLVLEIRGSPTGPALAAVTGVGSTAVSTPMIQLPATQVYVVRIRGASTTQGSGGYKAVVE